MKRIFAIESWCIDCKRCEVACRTFHSRTRDTVKAHLFEDPKPVERVNVAGDLLASIAINCRHCDNPPCVAGCISGAMTKNPVTGIVTSDPDKCVGCRTCMSMCPYGAVKVVPYGQRAIAFKCDLCGEKLGEAGEPQCVAACPNRALIYVDCEEVPS